MILRRLRPALLVLCLLGLGWSPLLAVAEEAGGNAVASDRPLPAAVADPNPAGLEAVPAEKATGSEEECGAASPDFFLTYKRPPVPASPFKLWGRRCLDIAIFCAMLGIGMWVVFTKRRPRKWFVAMALFSVAYLGFFRHGCICAVGSIGNVAQALTHPSEVLLPPPPPPPEKETELPGGLVLVAADEPAGAEAAPERHEAVLSVEGVVFFFLPLLVAMFAGRVFCVAVCPFGALQELLSKKSFRVPAWLDRPLGFLPWVMLAWAVLSAWLWFGMPICQLDPFVPVFRLAANHPVVWLYSGFFLALCVFVYRPYCRWICPYGVLLNLATKMAWQRQTAEVNKCQRCGPHCPGFCMVGSIGKDGDGRGIVPILDRRRLRDPNVKD